MLRAIDVGYHTLVLEINTVALARALRLIGKDHASLFPQISGFERSAQPQRLPVELFIILASVVQHVVFATIRLVNLPIVLDFLAIDV
jgi:hypothetical protein